MKKILLILIISGHASFVAFSQNKLFSMEDAVLNQRTTLAPKRLNQLMWIKGSNAYSYVDKQDKGEVLLRGIAGSSKLEEIISLVTLNASIKTAKETEIQQFPSIQWEDKNVFSFEKDGKVFYFDVLSKKIKAEKRDLGVGASNLEKHPKSGAIAYTIENNLWVFNKGNNLQITKESEKNILHGSSVHRDEFGIHKGTFWSPLGQSLAFYRMDQTMVTDYPLINYNEKPVVVDNIKYPFAGDKSHQVTVGVYNLSTGAIIYLKTGEPVEQYLTNIAWSPDEKSIYIAVLNRDQNHLKLNRYSAISGEFEKTLFEEKHEKYIQPIHTLQFVKNNPEQFIWHSERDGFNHLYLYNIEGKLIKQLTKGKFEVTDFAGFDAKGEKAFYTSTEISPLNRDFYSISFPSGEIKRLTNENGYHTAILNENGEYFIDHFSNTEVPRLISIISSNGKTANTLLKSVNPLQDYRLGKQKIFTLKSDGGDDLYCRMITPIDFDSAKKYPCIVYLYNGPNVQLITNSWLAGGDLWYQYMAQRGFVVFTLDGRGSYHRGKEFEQATFRQLGTIEMRDQLMGVNYLKSNAFIDTTRIGVHGWSYGGFMTTSLMTRHPEVFKVGVGGGPVIDWSLYEIMYTERYMDTPQTNKEGYEKSNLLNHVDKLKGKLMLIHGTVDDVVVWQHSIQYVKKAVDKGVLLDYFVYPGHPHNVRGKDRVHLMNKITEYFIQNL